MAAARETGTPERRESTSARNCSVVNGSRRIGTSRGSLDSMAGGGPVDVGDVPDRQIRPPRAEFVNQLVPGSRVTLVLLMMRWTPSPSANANSPSRTVAVLDCGNGIDGASNAGPVPTGARLQAARPPYRVGPGARAAPGRRASACRVRVARPAGEGPGVLHLVLRGRSLAVTSTVLRSTPTPPSRVVTQF